MTEPGRERRTYPRTKRGFKLPPGYSDIITYVDNISAAGVLFHTVEALPVMTRLEVTLLLPEPSGEEIEAEGIVVRCESDEGEEGRFFTAMLFTGISEGARAAINRYVTHHEDEAG